MSEAGTVAILTLLVAILRALVCRVAVLPHVAIPVAGLVLATELMAVACFAWWMIRRIRTEPRSWRPCADSRSSSVQPRTAGGAR